MSVPSADRFPDSAQGSDRDTHETQSQAGLTVARPSTYPVDLRGKLYSYEVLAKPADVDWPSWAGDTCDYTFESRAFEGTGRGAAPPHDSPGSLLSGERTRSRKGNDIGGWGKVFTFTPSSGDNRYPEVVLSNGEAIRPHRMAIDWEPDDQAADDFAPARAQFFCWVPNNVPFTQGALDDLVREEPRAYRIVSDRAIVKGDPSGGTVWRGATWQYQLIGNDMRVSPQTFTEHRTTYVLARDALAWDIAEYVREPGGELFSLWSSSWKDAENLDSVPHWIEDIRDLDQPRPAGTIPTVVHHFVPEGRDVPATVPDHLTDD